MKIVHLVESLALGGLEHVVLSLAAWQQQQGESSRIICLFEAGALAARAREQGIELQVIGKRTGLDWRALWALRRALRAAGADVLHTHNAVAHYHAVLASVGQGMGRIVNTRHGMGVPGGGRVESLYRLAMAGTDAVAFVSRAGRAHFVQGAGIVPAGKAHVIPNGIVLDTVHARRDEARQALLATLGRPSDTLLLGSVGRLHAVKGHATLLQALQQLRQAGMAVELVLVGEGATRQALLAQAQVLGIAEQVHFLGQRADVGALLAAFDVFVLPSLSEGYSLALVEAAAAALPLVATRVGGNADIVQDGVNGLLVESQDVAALTAALRQLLGDAGLRARMGQAGRAWALAHGSIDAMGRAYQALYTEPARVAR